MELELGLKVTRTREDVSSSVDFRFSKDPFGPLVLSRETDSRFIIIIHLKGFKKEGIEIEINKEGNRITIRGRKPVEEMVLIRWMAWMKEVELRTFKKVFLIPDIVDLDKIKARFDDDDATLTITMPKRVKGISGYELEEEEEESVDYGDVSETQNREEEFGEMMEDKERESQVFEGEEKGFSGGLDGEETQIEDDDLEKIQQIDEQDKILGLAEEETVSQEELADMNAENEDCSLRKIPEIPEQEDNQEVMEKQVETKSEGTESRAVEEETQIEDDDLEKIQQIDEQEKILELVEEETVAQEELSDMNAETEDSILRKLPDIIEQEDNQEVMEKQVENKIEGIESRAVEEIEEPDELDRTSKSKEMEKKRTDGDDDGLRKAQGIEEPEKQNEESKVQEMVEEETGGQEEVSETETKAEEFESEKVTVGQQEFAGTNTEIEDSILSKIPDILEQENNQEVMEQKVSQVETKSDDTGSKAIEEQEPDERLDRTSDGVETEKKTTDDDGDGLRKVQGIEEPEGHSEGSKIQNIIEGTRGEEKKEIKNGDPGEDVDEKMGEGFTPNTERTGVIGEDDRAETETNAEEFESGKPEADEVEKKHELVGKIEEEEETANVKDMVEEKTPEAETNTENDVPKPVQEETGDEGKQEKGKKKSVEVINRDAKEEFVGQMGVPNIAETETKPAEFESDKLVADEVDKIHELIEKKKKEEEEETNAKVGTQSEDISLRKPQEIQEQQSHGEKRHDKHEKIKELVEEKTPEAETNIGNETPKQVQERCDGKQKIKENFQDETKKQPEEHKEKMVETGEKINDAGSRKSQEIIRQQGVNEPERWEKESKLRGSVERKTNDEKEIADTETKEQESYRPKILKEEEKVQEPAEEKMIFSKNRKLKEEEKIPERKTEFGDDDVSRKVGDNQQRDSDAKEQVDQETETKAEKFEPHKLEPDEVDEIYEMVEKKEGGEENDKVRRQNEDRSFIKLQENEKQHSKGQNRQEKTAETETNIPKPVQEIQVPKVETLLKTGNEGKEGKEKKKSAMMEIKNGYPKEEADAEMGEGFTQNIEENETKSEEFEPHKLEPDEIDEMHELVEKKEEEEDNANVRRQGEESSLVKKIQETEEQQFQGQKRHNKQEKAKELLDEKTPKPVQVIEEPEVDTLEKCGEKEIAETEAKEKDSYRPKTLVEQEKIQELAEEEVAEKKTELGDDDHHISRKVGDIDKRDSDTKEEVDAEMGDRFTPNISETEKKAGEVGKLHELVDKKKEKEEENDKLSKKSEDTSLKRLQEEKFQGPNKYNKQENIKELVEEKPEADTNIADEDPKPVQETAKPEVETLEMCEDKESAETETKEQESYRPKILRGEDKIQELGEEKMNFSRKVEEKEKVSEKKTELSDDNMSRKVRDIEQQGSDAMKGEEEKDKIQELVLEEKASDGGKRIVAEATAENDKSRKVQENDKQQPHEEGKRGNQFRKVIGGEISGHGEVEDVGNEKQTTEAEKRLKDSAREAQATKRTDSDVSGKCGKGDMIQELEENRTTYKNEQEEEKEDEANGPEKVIGTRKPEKDKTKEEESETKTDDVVRKVEGIKEHELFEPKRDHGSKVKEVVEEKVAESEIKAECGGLSKAHGSEEHKLHKPDIHKESSNTKIYGTEEPSDQEKEEEKKEKTLESMTITEKENSTNVQEVKEERADKPETHEKRYKIQELVEAEHNNHKEEQQDEKLILKAKWETGSKNVQEIEKQESDRPKRSAVQDKKQETKEKEITRAKKKNGSLRKVQDDANVELSKPYKRQEEDRVQEPLETGASSYRQKVKKQDRDDILRSQDIGKLDLCELKRQCKQRKIHQPVKDEKGEGKMENISEPGGIMEGDISGKFHEFQKQKSYEDWRQEESEQIEEATGPKDKHTGGKREHEEERYEKVPQAKTKVEDGVNKKVVGNRKEEENLVDDSTTKIQETEKEESHESKIHEKLDIVQDFVEDKTGEQEDEMAGEPAVVVANNEKDSSRNLHSIQGEEHKEQDEIPETSDPKVKEADGERVSEKETKEQEAHVQELKGKTENFKDGDVEASRGEKGKQGKTVETKSDHGILGMIRDTEVQESNETKNQELEEKIGELLNEDDSLIKGQEILENESSIVSKRRSVEQEEIQQLNEVGKRDDEGKSVVETKTNADKSRKLEMQGLDEKGENEELKKIQKPMEEKTNVHEKEKGKEGSEKISEVKMQDKTDIIMKDQDTKRQEPYELLENEEHDKIPEPIVQGTKYQREEEKRMADRETEERKRKYEDVSSRQKIKAEESVGLEKHRKLSNIQENQSVKEKIQDCRGEDEVNQRGGYKAVLKTKSMEDSSRSQEKGSDQTEQENIQGLMVEEEGREEYHIREGEQNEKAKIIPQVESNANDDNSKKNVTERLSGQKQNEDHQELVEMDKLDQWKEEREDNIVGKGETIDHEYKIQEHEEENSDKLERHREEQRSGSLAEEKTSNDKEENKGNRAGAERKIRDDGFEEEEELAQETLKKSFVEGKARENKNHDAKSRDDNSRKTQENEKQESREQKRNHEEQDKKNMGPNYSRNEEDGKEDKEIAEAEGPRELNGIENQDNINKLLEEKMNNQEGEDKKSMSMEVLTKSEDHESEEPERLLKQDKSMEVLQPRLRDNLEDEETEKTETKTNDKESRKIHQINDKETGEEDRREEQASTKGLVEDRTQKQNREDGSLKIPEIYKEELTEPGRDEKPDEIEEPVDREASEDDEEELEVEVEDSEEDWEAEVVQEMDSDEDNDKIRQIKRIKLGFRLVGGSTLFMSFIVIVISIIRSKRKIRCYKF